MPAWNSSGAALLLVVTVLLGTSGCGNYSVEESNVRRATTAFFAAVSAHHDESVCADLVSQAAQGLVTSDSVCAEQIAG
jgi:hypothetical protein